MICPYCGGVIRVAVVKAHRRKAGLVIRLPVSSVAYRKRRRGVMA